MAREWVSTTPTSTRCYARSVSRLVVDDDATVAGLEVIVGVTQDPLFGPLLLFGLGGVTAELLADRALRILPVTDEDAHELVRSLRTSPLLFGYGGAPSLDVAALEDVILRVAQLAQEVPEITEMDLNPIIVREHGVSVRGARIRCAHGAALDAARATADARLTTEVWELASRRACRSGRAA